MQYHADVMILSEGIKANFHARTNFSSEKLSKIVFYR